MEEKAAKIINLIKLGGVSLPPFLILVLSIWINYIVYPHPTQKTQVHTTTTNKQTKAKISTAKVTPHSVKNKTLAESNIITTPTPITAQISPTSQPPTVNTTPSAVTITPTQAPTPTVTQTEPQITQSQPEDDQNDQANNPSTPPSNPKNLTLAKTKEILPVIDTLINSLSPSPGK